MRETYIGTDQPCQNFEPKRNGMGIRLEHCCPKCEGTRCECANCDKDHHIGGWDSCLAPNPRREEGEGVTNTKETNDTT